MIQDKYVRDLFRKRKDAKAYFATNLTYAWFCKLGLGLSTDPWDFYKCPFKKFCGVGSSIEEERCPYWSFSRRIFPKVFPTIERRVYGLRMKDKERFGIFYPLSENRIRFVEEYIGVQWNMPSTLGAGRFITLSFVKPIVRSLPETNIVGFAIPIKLIYMLADNILDNVFQPKPILIPGNEAETNLMYLLISKFFLWKEGDRGLRLYRLLGQGKGLLRKYKKFIKRLLVKREKKVLDEFKSFISEILGHSLAHLLVSFLASKLELDIKDLLYHSFVDRKRKLLFVLVAENSPFGNLNLTEHVNRVFGSIEGMIENFLDNIVTVLQKHEEELREYKKMKEDALRRYSSTATGSSMMPLVNKITEYYDELVKEGLVLDINSFTLHLILSQLYEKFANEENVNLETARRELDNILSYTGPNFCIDGCTGCVIFDRGCHNPLGQVITLSRGLVHFFLEIFWKEKSVIARSDKFGPPLLETLSHRKLLAISPYIDKKGIELLNSLANKGVNIILVTRWSSIEDYLKTLEKVKICFSQEPRHEKIYIIDGNIIVHTTWNLTVSTKSTNEFRIEIKPSIARQLEKEILSKVECHEI